MDMGSNKNPPILPNIEEILIQHLLTSNIVDKQCLMHLKQIAWETKHQALQYTL
jgi:hypothetical protein